MALLPAVTLLLEAGKMERLTGSQKWKTLTVITPRSVMVLVQVRLVFRLEISGGFYDPFSDHETLKVKK